jgi:hypothetical protein
MASKPANIKLYNMIVAQAKAKYSTYPNPGASHWVHKRYVESGGKFIETTEDDRKKTMQKRKAENEKRKKFSEKKVDDKKSDKKDKGKK